MSELNKQLTFLSQEEEVFKNPQECTSERMIQSLKVYIDGVFAGSLPLEAPKNLTVKGKWAIGRNEEFPGERIYEGYMDNVKIFGEALTESEVSAIYKSEKQSHNSTP